VIPFHQKSVRAGAHEGKHFFGGFKDEVPPAPRDGRGEEGGDFPIVSVFVTVGKFNRVQRDEFRPVYFTVETIKLGF